MVIVSDLMSFLAIQQTLSLVWCLGELSKRLFKSKICGLTQMKLVELESADVLFAISARFGSSLFKKKEGEMLLYL